MTRSRCLALAAAALGLLLCTAVARADDCRGDALLSTSFIEIPVPNIATQPPSLLRLKGKLSLPAGADGRLNCLNGASRWPAVLILHGSAGIDSRGDFYQEALNKAGIATLQVDMWEARGVTGLENRPAAPIFTYPDAFAALAFLSAHPRIAPDRIGVLGFSWGGVVSLAAAEQLYSGLFGGGRRFAAHVANYPVCWGANNTSIPALFPPAQTGTQFINLTGAPVLIQIGSADDYDNGAGPCRALAGQVNPSNNNVVEVAEYPGAYHAWDRIMIPVTAQDPFANRGSFFSTGQLPTVNIVPNPVQAQASRQRAVRFFKKNL